MIKTLALNYLPRRSPQVLSSIYNVSQLSSRWISVVPLSTLETPKQKSTFKESTLY
jgi:hypothetical protein